MVVGGVVDRLEGWRSRKDYSTTSKWHGNGRGTEQRSEREQKVDEGITWNKAAISNLEGGKTSEGEREEDSGARQACNGSSDKQAAAAYMSSENGWKANKKKWMEWG